MKGNNMKYFIICLLFVGCGRELQYVPVVGPSGSPGAVGATGSKGNPGNSGSNGSQGVSGNNGTDGSDGYTSLVAMVNTSTCSNGGYTILSGLDSNRDGILESNEVIASAQICDGLNGAAGATGQTGATGAQGSQGVQGPAGPTPQFNPVSLIAPCTVASSPYKEELLCLNNGDVLASFSDTMSGSNTRFALIGSGSFIDTDDSGCNFSVSIDNSGDTTVSWSSGSNQYATWTASSITCVNN